jgi:putative hemolysin
MVHDAATGKLAGTYRMQSGNRAKGNLGYCGECFFDFTPFERFRSEVLELGRVCVREEYGNTSVLHMLWKGIARYAVSCKAHYLIGCNSLSSQNEDEGMALYEVLRERYLATPSVCFFAVVPGHKAVKPLGGEWELKFQQNAMIEQACCLKNL